MLRPNQGRQSMPEIYLDIHLAEDMSREGISDLIVELFRFLLQQRQQIPLSYSTLLQDISSHKNSEEGVESDILTRKERRDGIRKMKEKSRFLKKASQFSSKMEILSKNLKSEIIEKDLETATIFFGATPVTPKEVYHIHLPPLSSNSGSSLTSKVKRQLFRSLVTHEELFTLLGRPLQKTNIYTAIKYKYLQPSNGSAFRPKPQFRKAAHRGYVVNYNFILPLNQSTPGTNMKRKRHFSHCTPVPMDICTPFTITKSRRRNVLYATKPPISTMKRLQADFMVSAQGILEEDEEINSNDGYLGELFPIDDGHPSPFLEEMLESEPTSQTYPYTPSSVNSIIDSHQEKWFVSSLHLTGIK
ncbi:uncharacterized protein [Lepeophtheirus salmonis]|uniref:uncharacterized protein n=1 Tax=Lepeophtheirus salmonis TaxID=72036 RepID=UPI001AE8AA2F|nr:uncharacterized protein LOC121122117 [Lepeophtheirus salmonis]